MTQTAPMMWAYPMDRETRAALTPSDRTPDVNILISQEEYQQHRAADDEWTGVIDQLSGRQIFIARGDCGAGCRCAMDVSLTKLW